MPMWKKSGRMATEPTAERCSRYLRKKLWTALQSALRPLNYKVEVCEFEGLIHHVTRKSNVRHTTHCRLS